MNKLLTSATVSLLAVLANGQTNYWKLDNDVWAEVSGYSVDEGGTTPATELPGGDDIIHLPASRTFPVVVPSAEFSILSQVRQLKPADGSKLDFTVADDGQEHVLKALFTPNAANDENRLYGTLVKRGAGTLVLGDGIRSGSYEYLVNLTVEEGVLKMPTNTTSNCYFGKVNVGDEGTLFTCKSPGNASMTYVHSLGGDGLVTNDSTRASEHTLRPMSTDLVSEFAGTMAGKVRFWPQGAVRLTGTNSTCSGAVTVTDNIGANYGTDSKGNYRGFLEFFALGRVGYPSSLGLAETVLLYGDGSLYHYLGTGERTDKRMHTFCYSRPSVFDAGATGGVIFENPWEWRTDSYNAPSMRRVVLTGSNTVACVLEKGFVNQYSSDHSFYVTKRGTGTWRIEDGSAAVGKQPMRGGFAVEEGTLQFLTLAEKGADCSLGRADILTEDEAGAVESKAYVPYAFRLGSWRKDNAVRGTLEHVGTERSVCLTRPAVIDGEGEIKSSTTVDGLLTVSGVSAKKEGVESTLVLAGENANNNRLSNVSNGVGRLNVVKEGAGKWTLSGDLTFSGDLVVKEGELEIAGNKYSWFRWTVKQLGGGAKSHSIQLRELALYDREGRRQNIGLGFARPDPVPASSVYVPADCDVLGLRPGRFTFGSEFRRDYEVGDYSGDAYLKDLDQIFDDIGNSGPNTGIVTNHGYQLSMGLKKKDVEEWMVPTLGEASTWVPFVMRLTNGAPEIAAYDIQAWNKSSQTNTWPRICTMEASTDGLVWDLVETNASGQVVSLHDYDFSIPLGDKDNPNRWYSDGTAQINRTETGSTPRPGTGFPVRGRAFFSVLENVRSVSVAAGATLSTLDEDVEMPSLRIDANGAGTLSGFSFATRGHLQVDNMAQGQTVVLPGSYENCRGLENVGNWALTVNGKRKDSRRIVVKDGKIAIMPSGMILIVW